MVSAWFGFYPRTLVVATGAILVGCPVEPAGTAAESGSSEPGGTSEGHGSSAVEPTGTSGAGATSEGTTGDATTEPTTGTACPAGSSGCACDFGGVCDGPLVCVAGRCEEAAPGVCGDGALDPGEACDAGAGNGPGEVCKQDCSINECGDGDRGPGEACDDGNFENTDACTAMCVLAACGDGVVQPGSGEVCDDGNVEDGDDCSADCSVGTEVLAVYAGFYGSCAILTGGRVKCWGLNIVGNLGLGDIEDRGDEPGEMGAALPYVDLGPGKSVVQLAIMEASTCALLTDATVKCWGYNAAGELGLGDNEDRGDEPGEMGDALPVVDLGPGAEVVALVAGRQSYVCALLGTGAVKCWGSNYLGMLGLGDQANRGDMPGEMGDALPAVDLGIGAQAVDLAAGTSHSCARLVVGVKCWGYNHRGQLGLGDDLDRGDGKKEMGDALPLVNLGRGKAPVELALGTAHSCARWADMSLRCWGFGGAGILGQGDIGDIGDEPGEMGDALPTVDLGEPVTAIRAGGHHSCAGLQSGAWKCWGQNDEGQLGLGDTAVRGDDPGEMGDGLPILDLGPGRQIVAVSTGLFHNCALLDDGSVRCWGYNLLGRLGLGDTENRGDEPGEMGAALPAVVLF